MPGEIRTERLSLMPLQVSDASEMLGVLADDALYEFTGGMAPTFEELTARYTAHVAGSGIDSEIWYNWIVRRLSGDRPVGLVQATVTPDGADLAWVIAVEWQGRGFASEAATAMRTWLVERGGRRFVAHIHLEHTASQRVAAAIGLHATGELDEDGEEIWVSE